MRIIIGTIKKNSAQDVQVALDKWKGHHVIDVRIPFAEGKMTTKGLTMGAARWKELLPMIAAAIEEFEKQLANPDSEYAKDVATA